MQLALFSIAKQQGWATLGGPEVQLLSHCFATDSVASPDQQRRIFPIILFRLAVLSQRAISVGLATHWYKNPGDTGGDWIEYHIGLTGRGNGAHDVEVGDFNKDGKIDVAVNAGLFIQNNPGSWTFVDIGRDTEEGTGVGNCFCHPLLFFCWAWWLLG